MKLFGSCNPWPFLSTEASPCTLGFLALESVQKDHKTGDRAVYSNMLRTAIGEFGIGVQACSVTRWKGRHRYTLQSC